jgi:ACS family hexuronate transporter-like MFS transporter
MKIPHLRWWIAAVLVCASVLNYLDRAALGFAATQIKAELHLTETQYASILSAFLAAYTLSYLFGGMLVDGLGTRRSLVLTIGLWSTANMTHALAHSSAQLMACRFFLGLGEAAFYPAAMRACTEWFVPRDRSKPIGLFLGGASLGAVIAPIVMAGMMDVPSVGWRGAFALTGALGFLLIPAWLFLFRLPGDHPRLTFTERDYLASDPEAEPAAGKPAPAWSLLRRRDARVLLVVRALTDASWSVLLFWLGKYFREVRGFDNTQVMQFLWVPYATADVGALVGGWVSSGRIRRGAPLVPTRTTCMLLFALLLPCSLLGFEAPAAAPLAALALISVATFGHMAFGTNNLALHADLFPSRSVGTIMGLTGAAGALAGIGVQMLLGHSVDVTRSYFWVFLTTACLHPVAGLIVKLGLRKTAAR